MKLAENLLRHIEHELREDLYTVVIDALGAIHIVLWLHIWELVCEALAIEVLFLIARSVEVVAVRDHHTSEAVIFAGGKTWLIFLSTAEEAELILLINKGAEILIQVGKSPCVKGLFVCHCT